MAAHVRLTNGFMEDEMCHNLSCLIWYCVLIHIIDSTHKQVTIYHVSVQSISISYVPVVMVMLNFCLSLYLDVSGDVV